MTAPRWDAEDFHRKMTQRDRPAPRRDKRPMVIAGVVAALLVVVGVSATQVFDEPERIGVCHATGSDTNPYRLIVVDRDGYEHGHHRNHEHDFFVDVTSGDCLDFAPPPAWDGHGTPPSDGTETPAGNGTSDPQPPADNGTSDPGAGGGSGGSGGTGNGTSDGDPGSGSDDGNTTDDGTDDGNSTDYPEPEPPTGNWTDDGTGAGNGTEDPAPGDDGPSGNTTSDVRLRQWTSQDAEQVHVTIQVDSIGDGTVHGVSVSDVLPDLRRAWLLVGADGHCVLDGRSLDCYIGDLAPGESAVIQLRAYTDRMPCGQDQVNTAIATAADDAEARNNAASAGIAARSC